MGACVYLGECSSKPQGWKFYHGMRVLIQRVARASVMIEGHDTQMIQAGLVLLVGVEAEDGPEDVQWLTYKITQMRLFNDDEGKMPNIFFKEVIISSCLGLFKIHTVNLLGSVFFA